MDKKIARELLKVAKELVADSGDIPVYFNMYNYFQKDGGKIGAMESREIETFFDDFTYSIERDLEKLFLSNLKRQVSKDKRFSKWMKDNDISLKK